MVLNVISVPYAGEHARHPAREPIRFTGRFDPRLFSTFNVMSSPATVPQTCKAARVSSTWSGAYYDGCWPETGSVPALRF